MISIRLDKVASQLQEAGLSHLAALLDAVANTIGNTPDPEVVAAFGPEGPLVLFCDMDGVLADFEKGYLSQAADLPPMGIKLDGAIVGNSDFWMNLDWQPGGKELWSFIRHLNPTLLTAPPSCYDKGTKEQRDVDIAAGNGKKAWAQSRLGIPAQKVILERNKWLHLVPGKVSVLIDDGMHNITPWGDKGGAPVHHDTYDSNHVILDEGKVAVSGTIEKLVQQAKDHTK